MRISRLMLLFFIAAIQTAGGDMKDLAQSIPKKILDWESVGQAAVYDRKTIYDYMDGGAEVYLAFDFRNAFVRKYKNPSGEEIALDIYDMGSPEEAFGVFSCDREDPEAGIGQESEYGFGLLRFRQGRFFVSITAAGDEKRAEKAILELGKAVVPLLGPAGPAPDLLQCLPESGLKENRTSYFHAAVNLNNRFFISSENILGLGKDTDCVFAEYAAGPEETGDLLIVRYQDEDRAKAACESFLKAYLPEADPAAAALTENGKWTLARTHRNYLAAVFEAPSKEYAEGLCSAIRFPQK
ncbi:MAG: hypothetical protein A2Y69_05990 [Candidatus Aminicenantes bacterium RBG_13_59_9]|jgi:hypothetical protein|nr:MAG: hypothetical protein A2Y69_05990 [Candidatus Aminicenantes bacterium RBG_13_59_9]